MYTASWDQDTLSPSTCQFLKMHGAAQFLQKKVDSKCAFCILCKTICPDGGIGRRNGLKIRRLHGHKGSTPFLGIFIFFAFCPRLCLRAFFIKSLFFPLFSFLFPPIAALLLSNNKKAGAARQSSIVVEWISVRYLKGGKRSKICLRCQIAHISLVLYVYAKMSRALYRASLGSR